MTRDDLLVSMSLAGLPGISIPVAQPTKLPKSKPPQHFVPAFPLRILQALVEADAVMALPLVLAIHRQLTMSRRDETPLNEAVWKAAGGPAVKRRAAILRKLKGLPEVIHIIKARTWTSHYRVRKGRLWEA